MSNRSCKNSIHTKINLDEDFGNYRLLTCVFENLEIKVKINRDQSIPSENPYLILPQSRLCLYEKDILVNWPLPIKCSPHVWGWTAGWTTWRRWRIVFPTLVGMNRHLPLLVMRGKLLGVHIGVYQPWYSVLFGNTWYKWLGELRYCRY